MTRRGLGDFFIRLIFWRLVGFSRCWCFKIKIACLKGIKVTFLCFGWSHFYQYHGHTHFQGSTKIFKIKVNFFFFDGPKLKVLATPFQRSASCFSLFRALFKLKIKIITYKDRDFLFFRGRHTHSLSKLITLLKIRHPFKNQNLG